MRKRKLIGLDKICNEFEIVLFDNSSLWGILESHIKEGKKNFLRDKEKITKDLLLYFNNQIKKYPNIYLTEMIFNEAYTKKKECFKKRKKNHPSVKEYENIKHSSIKIKKRFLKEIKKQERILTLNKKEKRIYNLFYNKNESLINENSLSVPDYDLLINCIALGLKRANSAMVSNDFSLLRSYGKIILERKISRKTCGAFVHHSKGIFLKYY